MKNHSPRRYLLPSFDPQGTEWNAIPTQTTCMAHVTDNGVLGKIVYIGGICMFFEEKGEEKNRQMRSLSMACFLSLLAGSSQTISAEHHKFFKENIYVEVKVYEGALRGLIILEVAKGKMPDFAGGAVDITSHPDFAEDIMMNNPRATMRARNRIAYEMFKTCVGA